jgi:prophage DNA circulation protein
MTYYEIFSLAVQIIVPVSIILTGWFFRDVFKKIQQLELDAVKLQGEVERNAERVEHMNNNFKQGMEYLKDGIEGLKDDFNEIKTELRELFRQVNRPPSE